MHFSKIVPDICRKILSRTNSFKRQTSLIPLFVAQSVSFILFIVISFLSIMLLSNAYFQLSIFTRFDNHLKGAKSINREISVLYIDPESYLTMAEQHSDPVDVEYRLLAEALKTVGDAVKRSQDAVIVGLDYALLKKVGESEGASGYRQLVEVMAELPDNLYLIFGGTLNERKYGIFYLRSDIIYSLVQESWTIKSLQSTSISYDEYSSRFFLANIHFNKATMRTGLKEGSIQIAAGYSPCLNVSHKNSELNSLIDFSYSLPFAMYMLGEVITEDNSLRANIRSELLDKGPWRLPQEIVSIDQAFTDRLRKKSGKEFTFWINNFLYYNFDKGEDIKSNNERYHTLYDYSSLVNRMPIPSNFTLSKYFFIAKEPPPQYLSRDSESKIISPIYKKNRYTGEIRELPALMAHVTALDNLLDRETITKASPLLHLVFILPLLFLALIFWRHSLLISIFSTGLALLVVTFSSFLLFSLAGKLLPIQGECMLIFALYALITMLRVIKTGSVEQKYVNRPDAFN